jgi:hypothetical protein
MVSNHLQNLFFENSINLFIVIKSSTINLKIFKKRPLNHLEKITSTRANQRRVSNLAPLSFDPGKTCRSRHTGNGRVTTPNDKRKTTTSVSNDKNHDLEEIDLQPHQQPQKPTRSQSTRPPLVLGAPTERR